MLQYGRNALEHVIRSIASHEPPIVPPPTSYKGDFFKDARLALVGVGILGLSSNGYCSLEKGFILSPTVFPIYFMHFTLHVCIRARFRPHYLVRYRTKWSTP